MKKTHWRMHSSKGRMISSFIFVFINWKMISPMAFILAFCSSTLITLSTLPNYSSTLPMAGTNKMFPSALVSLIIIKKAGHQPGMYVLSSRPPFLSCMPTSPVMVVELIPHKWEKSTPGRVFPGIYKRISSDKYSAKPSIPN